MWGLSRLLMLQPWLSSHCFRKPNLARLFCLPLQGSDRGPAGLNYPCGQNKKQLLWSTEHKPPLWLKMLLWIQNSNLHFVISTNIQICYAWLVYHCNTYVISAWVRAFVYLYQHDAQFFSQSIADRRITNRRDNAAWCRHTDFYNFDGCSNR